MPFCEKRRLGDFLLMRITLPLNRGKSGVVFVVALMTVFGVRSSVAETDYSWMASGQGINALPWSGGGNWSPKAPAGGPTATDNVVTPTVFGNILVDIAHAEVTNWTYNANVANQVVTTLSPVYDDMSLTISGNLSKSGTGALAFRNFIGNLSVSAGNIYVSGGSLSMGDMTTELSAFSAGSADISGGALFLNVTGSASITNLVSMSGTGGLYLAELPESTRSVSIGALSSASATTIVASNDFPSGFGNSRSASTLHLTGTIGSATYAGIIRSGGTRSDSTPSSLAVVKDGAGTQIFSGNSNIYNGGTTINAGTMLVNNTGGSGTGTGAVRVNGGVFGGTGFVAPTGANGVSVAEGGYIAPGAGVGTLTFDMGGTSGTVDLLEGGDFLLELGAANAFIGNIAEGSSDLVAFAGAAAGDVVFATDTTVDLLGTASGEGYYKLFDTSATATTWTGLTLGAATTGGYLITGGLTATNFGGNNFGFLILADGGAGTSAGDIYLLVVPEPSTLEFLAGFSLFISFFGRTRRR